MQLPSNTVRTAWTVVAFPRYKMERPVPDLARAPCVRSEPCARSCLKRKKRGNPVGKNLGKRLRPLAMRPEPGFPSAVNIVQLLPGAVPLSNSVPVTILVLCEQTQASANLATQLQALPGVPLLRHADITANKPAVTSEPAVASHSAHGVSTTVGRATGSDALSNTSLPTESITPCEDGRGTDEFSPSPPPPLPRPQFSSTSATEVGAEKIVLQWRPVSLKRGHGQVICPSQRCKNAMLAMERKITIAKEKVTLCRKKVDTLRLQYLRARQVMKKPLSCTTEVTCL